LGGLGGFGRKKKQEEPQQQQEQTQAQSGQPGSGILIESTTESSGFSASPVDASKFETPAGFKEVQAEIERRSGRGR
jgi:hypothetical protein